VVDFVVLDFWFCSFACTLWCGFGDLVCLWCFRLFRCFWEFVVALIGGGFDVCVDVCNMLVIGLLACSLRV